MRQLAQFGLKIRVMVYPLKINRNGLICANWRKSGRFIYLSEEFVMETSKIRPNQFVCSEGDNLLLHTLDESGFLVESALAVDMWEITITWSRTRKVEIQLRPEWATPSPQMVNYSLIEWVETGQWELRLFKRPCQIKGCFIAIMVEGVEMLKMYRVLLTEQTAFEFCNDYLGACALEGQELKNLAIEIWQDLGGTVV